MRSIGASTTGYSSACARFVRVGPPVTSPPRPPTRPRVHAPQVKLDRDRAARRAEAATRAALLDESALLQRRQEASELQRSRDVTATLRRSRQVLEEEVERMRLAIGVRRAWARSRAALLTLALRPRAALRSADDGRAIMQRSQEAFTEYAAHSTVTNSTLDRMRVRGGPLTPPPKLLRILTSAPPRSAAT